MEGPRHDDGAEPDETVVVLRVGEGVRIGGDVVVGVASVHCGRVQIAIGAPQLIEVHREEVFRAKHPDDRSR